MYQITEQVSREQRRFDTEDCLDVSQHSIPTVVVNTSAIVPDSKP